MAYTIPVIKFTLSIIGLSIASIQDYKTREINDWIWVMVGGIGASLTIIELIKHPYFEKLLFVALSIIFSLLIGLTIFKLGLMGGADVKALIALSITFPYPPTLPVTRMLPIYPIFIISVFENSILLSLITILYFASRNTYLFLRGKLSFPTNASRIHKLILFLIASRYDVIKTDWSKAYPIEVVDYSLREPIVKLTFFSNVNEEVDVESLKKAYLEGKLSREIWATIGLPMIIFMTIGLVVSIFIGDLVLGLISYVIKAL